MTDDQVETARLRQALQVIRTYVGDPTASVDARMHMIGHWCDEALAGREVPLAAGIAVS